MYLILLSIHVNNDFIGRALRDSEYKHGGLSQTIFCCIVLIVNCIYLFVLVRSTP